MSNYSTKNRECQACNGLEAKLIKLIGRLKVKEVRKLKKRRLGWEREREREVKKKVDDRSKGKVKLR